MKQYKMKGLLNLALIVIASISLWSCGNEQNEPEIPLEVLPSDLSALKTIYKDLSVGSGDYPVQWDLDDMSTWKNAGIEFDTIVDAAKQKSYLTVSSITIYLWYERAAPSIGLLSLENLKDLKIYGCSGSYLHGNLIPSTVESLLIDRLNPDDPGYIIGVPNPSHNNKVYLGSRKSSFKKLIVHGVDMKVVDCIVRLDASIIDLSHNTLEGEISYNYSRFKTPANLSYNRYTGLETGLENWSLYKTVPIVQHNLIKDIPQSVVNSEFWEKYHENFIGNPGYKAPEP